MRKRKLGTAVKRRGSWLFWYLIPVIFAALIAWGLWPSDNNKAKTFTIIPLAQPKQSLIPAWYGEAEDRLTMQFLDMLTKAADPNTPENAQMLPALKTSLQWIYSGTRNKGLLTNFEKYVTGNPGQPPPKPPFMASKYDVKGIPNITVIGPTLYAAIAENGGHLPASASRFWKNYFAISLAHEKIHLDNKKFMSEVRLHNSREEILDEELRTWIKTDLEIVRPMRNLGESMHRDFAKADGIIGNCGNKLPCQELRNFLETIY